MGTLVFQANLGGAVNLVGPNTASTVNFTLPSADGTNGQALVTNGSGTLSFSTISGVPGGSNTQVQFNSSGAFAGSSNLTFDGTSLTLGGNPTLSAGTANGVAYLNGSKVVTTGSALTFDGTALGVGIAGSAWDTLKAVDLGSGGAVYGTAGQGGITANAYYGTSGFVYKATNGASIYQLVADSHRWSTAASGTGGTGITFTEGMRLTSTGLGIGTSSPGTKLDVAGVATTNNTSRYVAKFGDTSSVAAGNGGGIMFQGVYTGTTLVDGCGIQAYKNNATSGDYAYSMTFSTRANGGNLTEQMRLDSSGNLGLGVTPSAWSATWKAYQTTGGSVVGSTSNIRLAQNWYHDGTSRYVASRPAAMFVADDGAFAWYNAPSGTAGNAITFTQAMTLDASGNLGVGTTSPASRVDVTSASSGVVKFTSSKSGWLYSDSAGIGLSDTSDFTKNGLYINNTSNYVAVYTGSTGAERARIDSSGNLLVGSTSTSSTTGTGFKVNSPIAGHWDPAVVTSGNSASYSCWDIYSTGAGAYRFYVTTTGVINATSTTITAISDERLKENIRDIDTGLDAVMTLKPRRFDWKEGKGQNKKNAAGFIAQEFETVFPDSVGTSKAGEDGIEYKNICHEELIPTLVKAIQEQQALITQLQADVAALKGN